MAETPQAVTNEDKLWAGLGYAGLVLLMIPTLIIFFLKKDESAYIKFNLLQALGYGIASLVLGILFSILATIPILGLLVMFVHFFVGLILFAYWIVLMVWAFMGKEIRIPLLGDFIEQNLMG
ncbi:MAG TPA: DUF4870 domain-containing protein [Oculatellaceae cyanobacterium]|jgi:uncharacterized membrane protein